jgi:hypothetical protein
MKKILHRRNGLPGILLALALCSGCAATKVETSSLKDTLIAIQTQAKAAGAKSVTYEASVVTTGDAKLAVVVPVAVMPKIGFGLKQEVASKVTITLDLTNKEFTALEAPSGQKYWLNLKTLEVQPKPAR